ncbi:hypothetical protein PINS_up007581 [Pythium insidiosum]|nr:hypothetical protein PINS_up007581 [Pythium insidiosum]
MLALLRHVRQRPLVGRVMRRRATDSAAAAVAAAVATIPVGPSALRAGACRSFAQASHMSVADLLAVSKEFRSKQTNYILQHKTLRDAVQFLAKNENSATLVVVDDAHKVVGLLTNHLVLERIAQMASVSADAPLTAAAAAAADAVNAEGHDRVPCDWDTKVLDVAIPAREILHVSPTDSLEDVSTEPSGWISVVSLSLWGDFI